MQKLRKKNTFVACVAGCLFMLNATLSVAAPTRGAGRAIIAGMSGDAFVRFPKGTMHQYPQGRQAVEEGDAFTDGHIIETDADGRLCIVLTPGAVLCVAGDSKVSLNSLREMPQGLPSSEQDVVRTIDLSVQKGGIMFYGGQPSPNNHFRIVLPDGVVETNGSSFECAQEKDGWKIVVGDGVLSIDDDGQRFPVTAGETGFLTSEGEQSMIRVAKSSSPEKDTLDDFELCDELYTFLNPLVFRMDGVDVDGVADLVGDAAGLTLLGDPTAWTDVSPSQPVRSSVRAASTPQGQPWKRGRLRPRQEMWNWYRELGVIKGVNYTPRNAVNAIEMWQEASFDADVIDEELGWAQDVGYGAIRVPLSFTVWQADPKAYLERMETFLDIADRNHLKTAFVLLDDTRRSSDPARLGVQPAPVPGVYNSQWVASPGPEVVVNRSRWSQVEAYVRGIVSEFKSDDRVMFWDVYHTPGNDNLWDKSLPLLESAFAWARDEGAQQPLTAGPWSEYASPMSVRIMELSDFISLQSFDSVENVKSKLSLLQHFDRPIICTDWLKRQNGNTFEDILPVFAENNIGWFNRGLVEGRTQLHIPDDRMLKAGEDAVWQQNVLKQDGSAYDENEIELIRGFNFR